MIVKLSLVNTGGRYLTCRDESAGYMIEFWSFDEGTKLYPCDGFNHALGFKMRYHVDEVDSYDNHIKLIKEI